ncbi:hypothetical protein [Yersinia pseudotuberculosis]|uniref:hypothetical protein n=1 Tax=Yersinia pseudotuberculosis TaxID=633 RepID=UPI001900B3E5|nr:hypothetical protein [Yersinia pseudotuberculosis]MBK1423836.1 hypothetical protein [Yersinia pseudotuberculosis]
MIAEGSNIDAEARKVIEQANFNMLRIIAQLPSFGFWFFHFYIWWREKENG